MFFGDSSFKANKIYAFYVFFVSAIFLSCSTNAQNQRALDLPGLNEPVQILRDEWGVNHIYASNQHDLFFAQGYAAAKDRLFQFEMWRRQATGTIAEILGPDEIQRDIGARLFKFRGDLKKELNHYHPEGEAIIEAYAKGVNAQIDEALQNPKELPFEFKLLNIKPQKWTPEVVISRHQGLLGNINEELRTGMAVAKAGENKVKELMWFHPKTPDLRLDSIINGDLLSSEILDLYNAFRKNVSFDKDDLEFSIKDSVQVIKMLNDQLKHDYNHIFKHGKEGSNNWAISGDRTASGKPMMASDPHRRVSVPSLRYLVHLVAPGWNVVGGGEPTIPGVSIGHNEYGAWGLTVHDIDGEDLYIYELNPKNLKQYNYKGEWRTMEELKEFIPVEGEKPVEATLRYTVHGPVTYIDSINHKGYAVKGAWMEVGGAPYLASLRMDQAKNWEEFREACSYSHIPGENMIWADKHGDIGWQAVGIGPVRENFSGMVPIPGDGRYEWKGYLPIKERPHEVNPERGYIVTANENVIPKDYPHMNTVSYSWADAFRGDRIREILKEDNHVTMQDMVALQTDYFSVPARILVPMLEKVNFDSRLDRKAKTELKDWNYVLDKGSIEAGIYAKWERKIIKESRSRFIPEDLEGLVSVQLTKIIEWLQNPDFKFGPDPIEGRNEFLKSTFVMAINELKEKFGESIADWKYGQEEYKHVELKHELFFMLNDEWKRKVNLGPLPTGGNSFTPNVTGSYDNMYHGATFRIIVDTGDWTKTLMINAPGQSGNPESPYYDNLFEMWADEEYFPSYFTVDGIKDVTSEILILNPATNSSEKEK